MSEAIITLLEAQHQMLVREIEAGRAALEGRVRRQMHGYAQTKLERVIALTLRLLPEPDAAAWLAMHRQALGNLEVAAHGQRTHA